MNPQLLAKFLVFIGICIATMGLTSIFPLDVNAGVTFELLMTGDLEIPGPGDPDGLATGTLFLDDITGELSWNFEFSDIEEPTAMHIHGPEGSVGNAAPVFIGLGVETMGGPGTLIDSIIAPLSDISDVLNNPTDFYVNIHNDDFPPGAVRGQLVDNVVPESSTIILLVIGIGSLLLSHRHNRL